MAPLIECWRVKILKKAAGAFKRPYRRHRLGHHARRVAGLAVSKPAIIGWTCLSMGWPAPQSTSGNLAHFERANHGLGQFAANSAEMLALVVGENSLFGFGEFETAALIPASALALPAEFFTLAPAAPQQFEVIGPPVLSPATGETTTLMPEPGTLGLLLASIFGMAAYRVVEIRKSGPRLVDGRLFRRLGTARLHARLHAVGNIDPAVTEYAVSNGKAIVFTTPASGQTEADHA